MKLVRLIYASCLVSPLTKAGVQNILAAAARVNPVAQITGFLCVSPRYALQCLEGPREHVNALYNRIAQDARHTRVELLHYSEPSQRTFAKWHMGFSNELSSAASNSARWHDADGLNPYLVDADMIENVVRALSVDAERIDPA